MPLQAQAGAQRLRSGSSVLVAQSGRRGRQSTGGGGSSSDGGLPGQGAVGRWTVFGGAQYCARRCLLPGCPPALEQTPRLLPRLQPYMGPPSVRHVPEDMFKVYFGAAHVSIPWRGTCAGHRRGRLSSGACTADSSAWLPAPGRLDSWLAGQQRLRRPGPVPPPIPASYLPLSLAQLAVAFCSFPGRILGSEIRPRRFK